MKQVGKVGKKWQSTRKYWIKNNPPDHAGYYTCGICHQSVHIDEVTIDHKIPRSHAPHLRYEMSNLQPAHWFCNTQKGSKHD